MTYKNETEFLKHYNIGEFSTPLVTVDIAIFTLLNGELNTLLVERGDFPHKGRWSLPGGFIDTVNDSDTESTAMRKLTEKSGVQAPYLEQVCSVGSSDRDPRGWSVTLLYMALIPYAPTTDYVDTVADARWWPVEQALEQHLAFDHHLLITQAHQRLRNKTAYTALPLHVLDAPFTLTQLQGAFEELLGSKLEKKSFRRRIANADLLDEVGEGVPDGARGRPAMLYCPKLSVKEHLFTRVLG